MDKEQMKKMMAMWAIRDRLWGRAAADNVQLQVGVGLQCETVSVPV